MNKRINKRKFLKDLIERIEPCACKKEFVPLSNYFKKKDYLKCFQTLLGNLQWLRNNNCMELSDKELEELAENIGIIHADGSGMIKEERTVVNSDLIKVKAYIGTNSKNRYLRNTYRYNDICIAGHDTYYEENGDVDTIIIRDNLGKHIHRLVIEDIVHKLEKLQAENERLKVRIKELEDSVIIHEKY